MNTIGFRPNSHNQGVRKLQTYFHFIVDGLFPLFLHIETHKPTKFAINKGTFGSYDPLANRCFPNQITWTENKQPDVILSSRNPKTHTSSSGEWHAFKRHVLKAFDIAEVEKSKWVVLIERQSKNRKNKNIRFIRNMDALENELRRAIHQPLQLMRVVLEDLDFQEQLKVLSNAACLIGQHGAGLTNQIWMPHNSPVMEIGYRSRPHFSRLAEQQKRPHLMFDEVDGQLHVDVDEFISFASEASEIRHIFQFNCVARQIKPNSSPNKLIVIAGLPKSGTSLFSALLDGHPQLEVFPQELRFFHLRLNDLPPKEAAETFFSNPNIQALVRKAESPGSHLTGSGGTEPVLSVEEFEQFKNKVTERFLKSRTARDRFEAIMDVWMEIRGIKDKNKHWVVRAPRNENFSNLWLGMYRKNVLFIKLNRHHLEHFAGLTRYWAARREHHFLSVERFRKLTEESNLRFQRVPTSQRLNVCLNQLRDPRHYKKEMRRVLEFLSLDWHDALTKTTFAGRSWHGNRADGPHPGIAWKKGIDRQLIRNETTWAERINLTFWRIRYQLRRP